MTDELRISETFAFPLELITDRAMILATTGAGKTYLERVVVEEVLTANQQGVVLDPKGDFWGLRSSADGKSPGFSIPVFGGEHADLPLEEGSGAFIAELIVRERLSAILDMSLFSKTKMLAWATDFAEALYHRNREAMMLVIDELHTFAPQKFKGHERMLGAFTDLFGKGRKRGIGTLGASQRSALVNKDVLDLTATMFFLRTGSPRDRDVVDDWLEYNADKETRRRIMEDLPKMENGEVWVYSPHSFKVLERMQVREARTFDSSATPRPGQAVRKPKTLAEIDVEGVVEQMQGAIERAKADDPKELKKLIASLRKNLRLAESKTPTTEQVEVPVEVEVEVIKKVEVPTLKKDEIERLERIALTISEAAGQMASAAATIVEQLKTTTARQEEVVAKLDEATKVRTQERTSLGSRKAAVPRSPRSAPPSRRAVKDTKVDTPVDIDGDFTPSKPQQRILNTLAWGEAIGLADAERTQLALLADQSPTSSAYSNNLGTLRSNGLIDYPSKGRVVLTETGRAFGVVENVPTTNEELWQIVFSKVGPTKSKILDALIAEYPEPIEKVELAARSEQSPTSSAFSNHLGALRSLKLIDYPRPGYVVATDALFLEGA